MGSLYSYSDEALLSCARAVNEKVSSELCSAIEICANKNVLSYLAESENTQILCSVASNSSTPPEVLAQLAGNENVLVNINVAANPSTPSETIQEMWENGNHNTYHHKAFASNKSTPPHILASLSEYGNEGLCSFVASNPSTPPNVLAELVKKIDENLLSIETHYVDNSDQFYEKVSGANPDLMCILVELDRRRSSPDILWYVALNPSTPPETLVWLSRMNDDGIRGMVGFNVSTPPMLLHELAEDEVWNIRFYVARNTSTDGGDLLVLAKDEDKMVRRMAQENYGLYIYLQHRAVQDGACEKGVQLPVEWLKGMYLK